MSRTRYVALFVGLLAAFAALDAAAEDGPWVRLVFKDGSLVEGALDGHADGSYRVKVGDKVVAFDDAAVSTATTLEHAAAKPAAPAAKPEATTASIDLPRVRFLRQAKAGDWWTFEERFADSGLPERCVRSWRVRGEDNGDTLLKYVAWDPHLGGALDDDRRFAKTREELSVADAYVELFLLGDGKRLQRFDPVAVAPATYSISGRTFATKKVTARVAVDGGDETLALWVCNDVPGGVVAAETRTEAPGYMKLELAGYGTKGRATWGVTAHALETEIRRSGKTKGSVEPE